MNVPTLDAIIRFLYHGSTLSDRQADEIIAFGEARAAGAISR